MDFGWKKYALDAIEALLWENAGIIKATCLEGKRCAVCEETSCQAGLYKKGDGFRLVVGIIIRADHHSSFTFSFSDILKVSTGGRVTFNAHSQDGSVRTMTIEKDAGLLK